MEWAQPSLCTDYPVLATYKQTMSDLPGLKEYLSNDCMEFKYTFNNKVAKLNNTVWITYQIWRYPIILDKNIIIFF